MSSLLLATAMLAVTVTPAQGCYGFHGCAGFQPYFCAAPPGPFCPPQHALGYQAAYAVPVVGGAAWGRLPCPHCPGGMYPVNPWGWNGGDAYPPPDAPPGDDAPPMKRIKGSDKPGEPNGPAKADSHGVPATLVVLAARDAAVIVNSKRMARTSDRETFRTPALEEGRRYAYEVAVTLVRDGVPFRETRRIEVEPGRRTEVDFRSLAALGTPAAPLPVNKSVAEVTLVAVGGTRVRVNGQAVAMEGRRKFRTPELRPGQKYHYAVEADVVRNGKTVTETRRVGVEAGKAVVVDFTEGATE